MTPALVPTGEYLEGAPLASFGRRGAALILDLGISSITFVLVVGGGLYLYGQLGGPLHQPKITLNLFGNWYSVVWHAAYFGLLTWQGHGQTPGKRLLGLRVASLSHHPLTLWQSLERALGYGASMLEFGFGFAQYWLNTQRQTVHDRIAETVVIDARSASSPEPSARSPLADVNHA